MHNKKASTISIVIIILAIIGLSTAGYFGYGYVSENYFSSGGEPGVVDGIWKDKFVYYKFTSINHFTGADVDPSFTLYAEKPESCWDQPRETTCDETAEATVSSSSGTATVQSLHPGSYFVIARLSSYYTQYSEIIIPDEPQSSTQSLSDYNQAPDSFAMKMKEADTLTTSNQTFAVSANTTGKEYTLTDTFTVSDNKCIRIWKADIYENNNSLTDIGTSVSYDGVRKFEVTINGGSAKKVIDLASGVSNGFDADGATQYFTVDVESRNIEICDGNSLEMKYYIKANVLLDANTTTVENGDSLLASNEIVSTISLWDVMGTKAPATGSIYVQGSNA